MSVRENIDKILNFLNDEYEKNSGKWFSGKELEDALSLNPDELNPAIDILSKSDLIKRHNWMALPYRFGQVSISSKGLYESERRKSIKQAIEDFSSPSDFKSRLNIEGVNTLSSLIDRLNEVPPTPVGSPYGFTDYDWEILSKRKADKNRLFVVLGLKFKSQYYDTNKLIENIKIHFKIALDDYNKKNNAKIKLEFNQLRAGYGEHLFNQIARDIISSDIAVFDTSDLAPNVFLEIGVAVTWGSRVFLIKSRGSPKPSSDISGQTYADYKDSAEKFLDRDFSENIFRMIERALQKKS